MCVGIPPGKTVPGSPHACCYDEVDASKESVVRMPEIEEQQVRVVEREDFDPDTLLLELSTERTRARRREAVFLSIIVHLCLVVLALINPKLFRSRHQLRTTAEMLRSEKPVFLESPLIAPRPRVKVHSPVISDQDRLLNRHDRVTNSISAPPVPPPAPAGKPAVVAQSHPPSPPPAPREAVAKPTPATQANNLLKEVPPPKPELRPKLDLRDLAAGGLHRAIADAARSRVTTAPGVGERGQVGGGGYGGPGGSGQGQEFAGAHILTDTQGVDFGPYLQRIVHVVKRNWDSVIPEVARLGKQGRVVIVFKIVRNGSVPGLQLISGSGTDSLDQAALAAISTSNPFPPLPTQFPGPEITLEFSFFYNMDPGGPGPQ